MPQHAVRWSDVSLHLLENDPHIVHFAGHGESDGELVFEDDGGKSFPVPVDALSDLFRTLKDNIRCVLLNACWSERQAQAIVQHIDFVVGMVRPVPDDAAIRFAAGFYRGLGFGRSVQTAFDLAKNEMSVASSSDPRGMLGQGSTPGDHVSLADIPRLLVRPGVDAAATVLIRG